MARQWIAFSSAIGLALVAHAQTVTPGVVRPFAAMTQPVAAISAPSVPYAVFGVDRTGRIITFDRTSGAIIGTALDIRPLTNTAGDGGLLSAAFSPDFLNDGFLYVYHNSGPAGDGTIARYQMAGDPPVANPASRTIILQYPRGIGHNGGWMGFSPLDGYLYLSLGDGGTASDPDPSNRSQDLSQPFFGKILRIDPLSDGFPNSDVRNYSIPAGNPFIGIPGDDEIWAYGLRNPWRCSFDSDTGDLWIGDVGQDLWEEINYQPATAIGGRNYGWKCTEGSSCTGFGGCDCTSQSIIRPRVQIPHDGANCSVTGGPVYRGGAIPELVGQYFCADWCSNRLWSLPPGSQNLVDRTEQLQQSTGPRLNGIVAIGEDSFGELYFCDFFGGRVSRLMPAPCLPEFNEQPASINSSPGQSGELSAHCFAKSAIELRWLKDGVPISNDDRIVGASTANLVINSLRPSDTGIYRLRARTACGETLSEFAFINVPAQCLADWDGSTGVDGDDVIAFFADWDANNADVDFSGGTDGDDLIVFFAAWDGGC